MMTIFFIIIVIIAFVVLGIAGWIFELLGSIIGFLFEGCIKSIGCLIWVILIILLLASVI